MPVGNHGLIVVIAVGIVNMFVLVDGAVHPWFVIVVVHPWFFQGFG